MTEFWHKVYQDNKNNVIKLVIKIKTRQYLNIRSVYLEWNKLKFYQWRFTIKSSSLNIKINLQSNVQIVLL